MNSRIFARSRILCISVFIFVATVTTGIAVPALADFTLTVYEQTGSINTYSFNQNDPRLFTDLAGMPGPVTLGYAGYDFGTGGCEFYDIFFCDSAGVVLDIGPGDPLPPDIFFKLECWDISCPDGDLVSAPTWYSAGNNIDAVSLNIDGQMLYGQAVMEEVYGLCDQAFELKTSDFADEALGPPDAGITKMGCGWTVITLYMGSVPSSDCEVVVNYPHSETTYYIGGQHTIDITPNTCSSSVSLELYKADSLLCHIADISGRWYEWYGVSDCGGGPGTDYRIKATCLSDPGCYDFSDYFTMAVQEPPPSSDPLILFVEDIGNDEGRQVRIKWQASPCDSAGSTSPVTGYALWRRIDPLPAPIPLYPPGDWDYLGTVPACCEETYATILPTLADSTAEHGIYWSVFFVRALTETPGIYFDSPPDSGWSVDNLAPAPAVGFSGVQSVEPPGLLLSWEPGTEEDIVCYDIHKGASEEFIPDESNLIGSTAGTEMLDTDWTPADENFYKIIAVDDSGNRGLSALLRPENISVGTYLQSFYALWRETCIEISWTLSEVGEETEFYVLRAEIPGMVFEEVDGARLERDGMEFVLKDLSYEPGMTYVYRVELEEEGSRRVLFETDEINAPALPLTLMQNVPNPFNPSTTIGFYLPEKAHVRVDVYDVTGRHMSTLIDEVRPGGSHSVEWNGVDKAGSTAASGVYFYRLIAGKTVLTNKMVMLR